MANAGDGRSVNSGEDMDDMDMDMEKTDDSGPLIGDHNDVSVFSHPLYALLHQFVFSSTLRRMTRPLPRVVVASHAVLVAEVAQTR